MMIICGNCSGKHETVAEVRECHAYTAGTKASEPSADLCAAGSIDSRAGGRVATPKMVDYVRSLAKEKSMDDGCREEAEAILAAHDSAEAPMEFGYARRFITIFRDAPRRVFRRTEAPSVVTEDGMYRSPDTGEIFKVQWNRASGNGRSLYAKRMTLWIEGSRYDRPTEETAKLWVKERDAVEFQYAPGAIRGIRPEWRMTKEEAKEFGALYGTCVRCGKTLTLEESIERAMGRWCAGKI